MVVILQCLFVRNCLIFSSLIFSILFYTSIFLRIFTIQNKTYGSTTVVEEIMEESDYAPRPQKKPSAFKKFMRSKLSI